ncbi:MAG: hypothetical protein HYX81_03985 [Chloroflexi bacterium]|nr:hypothetical protein [Chloroflexota bacterium]
MDNFSYMFSYVMERATTMLAYCLFAAIIDKSLEPERKQVRRAVGHEPSWEELQYYFELKKERRDRQNDRQREIDREKIRRLVFGEEEA